VVAEFRYQAGWSGFQLPEVAPLPEQIRKAKRKEKKNKQEMFFHTEAVLR
jgi:hypothetical protein